ncbi:MAG: PQQ-binding-like beta-propeller repeat protein [Tepidisphaerales bacterium]
MTQQLKPLMVLVASAFVAVAGRSAVGADNPVKATVAVSSLPSPERPVGWRGDGSGQYPSADPVTKWSAKENILWKTEVGTGSSSPIVVGSRLFITAEPDLLICLDAATGKELWRKAHKLTDFPAALNAKDPVRPSQYGNATPTAASDGKRVWVFFGTGIVGCYDLEGQARWVNWFDLRRVTNYGRTASPVLAGDRLLVHLGPLVCLEAATGKVLWKADRATATYGTPARARIGGVDIVITPNGDAVRIADGTIVASGLGHCMYTSPIVQGRMVYFIDTSMSAVQLPEQAGEKIEGKELWYEDLSGEFFASPVVRGGRIYAVNRDANYYVIDAGTGKTILKKTLDLPPAGRSESPNIYPSVCLAGKHLFVGNDAGESLLIEPGDTGTVVGSNLLPGGSGGTPVFSDTRMFVRGGKLLYCVGRPTAAGDGAR